MKQHDVRSRGAGAGEARHASAARRSAMAQLSPTAPSRCRLLIFTPASSPATNRRACSR